VNENTSGTPATVVTARCPECGRELTAAVTVSVRGNVASFHPIAGRRCWHQALDEALGDLAAGGDPEQRCENCDFNPCQGGRGPWSCEDTALA